MRNLRRRYPSGPLHSSLDGLTQCDLSEEKVVRVLTAKVVVADYDLIRNDFLPHMGEEFRLRYCGAACNICASQHGACAEAIDNWLLQNAAVVSQQQAAQCEVNTEIAGVEVAIRAVRPPAYGRALILEVFPPDQPTHASYIDVKGVGVGPGIVPTNEVHGNGLEYLGLALADYLYGWLIDLVFKRTIPTYHVVPTYAVIDLGFDIRSGWAGTAPAGIHVRRAHMRHPCGAQLPLSGSDEERITCQIEMLLRLFGLTSGTNSTSFRLNKSSGEVSYFGEVVSAATTREAAKLALIRSYLKTGSIEVVNVQLIRGASWTGRSAQLVDFGNINARSKFRHPYAISARDALYRVSRLVGTADDGYVQPVPDVALDGALFARETVNALAFQAAQGFRTGSVTRREIQRRLIAGVRRSGFHKVTS